MDGGRADTRHRLLAVLDEERVQVLAEARADAQALQRRTQERLELLSTRRRYLLGLVAALGAAVTTTPDTKKRA